VRKWQKSTMYAIYQATLKRKTAISVLLTSQESIISTDRTTAAALFQSVKRQKGLRKERIIFDDCYTLLYNNSVIVMRIFNPIL